jgi:hypothetical protein
MASLASLAGTSLYGTYTQGTNGLPPTAVSNIVGYSNPGPDGDNPMGSGIWGIGNKNFAFGNVKSRSINNRKSLHNAGAAGVSFYGPSNTSPGVGTGNYMDPFGGPVSAVTFNDVLSGQQYVNTNGQAPGTYTDMRGQTGVTPPF